jgi:hypothetical protein
VAIVMLNTSAVRLFLFKNMRRFSRNEVAPWRACSKGWPITGHADAQHCV